MRSDDSPAEADRRETASGYREDDTDPSAFPSTWAPFAGGWGLSGAEPAEETDERGVQPVEEDDSWLDEGLFTALVLVGAALFLFPEPSTSLLGVVLMIFGGIGWLVDAFT